MIVSLLSSVGKLFHTGNLLPLYFTALFPISDWTTLDICFCNYFAASERCQCRRHCSACKHYVQWKNIVIKICISSRYTKAHAKARGVIASSCCNQLWLQQLLAMTPFAFACACNIPWTDTNFYHNIFYLFFITKSFLEKMTLPSRVFSVDMNKCTRN